MSIAVEADKNCGRWLFKPKNNLAQAILDYKEVKSFSEDAILDFVCKGVKVKITSAGSKKYEFPKKEEMKVEEVKQVQ